jgi:hypothetical protein
VQLALQGRQGRRVLPGQPARLDLRELPGRRESQVQLVQQELRVRLGQREQQDLRVQSGRQVQRDPLERLVESELRERQDLLALRELRV